MFFAGFGHPSTKQIFTYWNKLSRGHQDNSGWNSPGDTEEVGLVQPGTSPGTRYEFRWDFKAFYPYQLEQYGENSATSQRWIVTKCETIDASCKTGNLWYLIGFFFSLCG